MTRNAKDLKFPDSGPVGKKEGRSRPPARCCPRGAPGISRRAWGGGGPTSVAGLPARPLEKVPTARPGHAATARARRRINANSLRYSRLPQRNAFLIYPPEPSGNYRLLLRHPSAPSPSSSPSILSAPSSLQLSHAFTNTYSAAAFGAGGGAVFALGIGFESTRNARHSFRTEEEGSMRG